MCSENCSFWRPTRLRARTLRDARTIWWEEPHKCGVTNTVALCSSGHGRRSKSQAGHPHGRDAHRGLGRHDRCCCHPRAWGLKKGLRRARRGWGARWFARGCPASSATQGGRACRRACRRSTTSSRRTRLCCLRCSRTAAVRWARDAAGRCRRRLDDDGYAQDRVAKEFSRDRDVFRTLYAHTDGRHASASPVSSHVSPRQPMPMPRPHGGRLRVCLAMFFAARAGP